MQIKTHKRRISFSIKFIRKSYQVDYREQIFFYTIIFMHIYVDFLFPSFLSFNCLLIII